MRLRYISIPALIVEAGGDIILTVPPRPPAGIQQKGHAWVDVDGECRDTSDHRTDGSLVPVNIANEIQQP